MRFLIDECLSIDLVLVASRAGHEAQHVARVGKAGWKDWNVARHAAEGDFVLVTNNGSDFRRLYATQPLHAGLVIIIPNVNRVEQQRLFLGALDELARFGEPVNQGSPADLFKIVRLEGEWVRIWTNRLLVPTLSALPH